MVSTHKSDTVASYSTPHQHQLSHPFDLHCKVLANPDRWWRSRFTQLLLSSENQERHQNKEKEMMRQWCTKMKKIYVRVCDSENESLSRKRNKSWYYLYRVDRNGVTEEEEEEEGVRRRGVVQFYHESVTMFSISI